MGDEAWVCGLPLYTVKRRLLRWQERDLGSGDVDRYIGSRGLNFQWRVLGSMASAPLLLPG